MGLLGLPITAVHGLVSSQSRHTTPSSFMLNSLIVSYHKCCCKNLNLEAVCAANVVFCTLVSIVYTLICTDTTTVTCTEPAIEGGQGNN